MREAMARVSVRTDASLNQYTPGSYPAVVKLILRSGESREVEAVFPKGHPSNPMSPAEVEAKFRACARVRLPSARQDKVLGKARELEKLASVAELMNDLAEGETGQAPA
jgi:2-methylcitrate dehydratase PrpD